MSTSRDYCRSIWTVDLEGECQGHLPYGEEGVLVASIELERASGLLATRRAPELCADGPS